MPEFLADYMSPQLWHYYVSVLIVAVPMVRIFWRAGRNPLWALGLLVPYAGYIICAVPLGFTAWPKATPLQIKKREKKA
ncbi:MAG: hypothetical protein PW788_05680 [Micavibrio sp.]|nr:hypothetical protein [Micavibrio sp.]